MMKDEAINVVSGLDIEPLSDDLLEAVAGASSGGSSCCSCTDCSSIIGGKRPNPADEHVPETKP
ncbi:MAG: hypothetical protein ABW277_24745 [Longimicrobiaceae bacterium]